MTTNIEAAACRGVRLRLTNRESDTVVVEIGMPDGDWVQAIEAHLGHPIPPGSYSFETGVSRTELRWSKSLLRLDV